MNHFLGPRSLNLCKDFRTVRGFSFPELESCLPYTSYVFGNRATRGFLGIDSKFRGPEPLTPSHSYAGLPVLPAR